MLIFRPLRHRPIALLWSGQVLSAVGDEMYKAAILWIAVGMIGEKAGYLAAVESASVMVLALVGGAWADHWDQRRTMIGVDLVRAAAALVIPIAAWQGHLSLLVLIPTAVLVAGLGAFFDPALTASLPRLARDADLLQGTNSLLESTRRLARIVGPGLIGALNGILPTIQFFTLDALTFLVSAGSVAALSRDLPREASAERPPSNVRDTIRAATAGFELVWRDSWLRYASLGGCLVWASWSLCFMLGLALHLHQLYPQDIGAYGAVIGAYGAGNLASNIVLGSLRIRRLERVISQGWIVLGLGFGFMALAPTLPLMMAGSAFAAIGGPMEDLSFVRVLQSRFGSRNVARIYRFRMASGYASMLVVFLASPTLFRAVSVPHAMAVSSVLMAATGVYGLVRFAAKDQAESVVV